MNTPVEDDLRAMLARHASTVPLRSDPYDLVTERVAVDRRRRIVASAVTAVLVVIAGILSAPMVSKLASPEFSPASRPADWPARGELAKDPGLRPFLMNSYGLQASNYQVLYAGDIGERRYVIFRIPQDPQNIGVLTSAAGSFAGKGERGQLLDVSDAQNAVAFVDQGTAGARATVFLLGAPGIDLAQYSKAPIVGPDGKVTRSWERLERKADGVFVGTLDNDPPSEVFRVRFAVDGTVRTDVGAANLMTSRLSVTFRLSEMAKNVTDTQEIARLNVILQRIERDYLGPGAIAMVGPRWRVPDYPSWETYNGLVVFLASGGAVELVVQRGNILSAEPVAPSRAWEEKPKEAMAYATMRPNPPGILDVPSTVGQRVR